MLLRLFMRMPHVGDNWQLQIHCWWFLGETCALAVLTEWRRKSRWQRYIYLMNAGKIWMKHIFARKPHEHESEWASTICKNEMRKRRKFILFSHEFVSNTILERAKMWKFGVPCANNTLNVWRIFHCWFGLRHVARGLHSAPHSHNPVSILQFIRTSTLVQFARCRNRPALLPVQSCLIG